MSKLGIYQSQLEYYSNLVLAVYMYVTTRFRSLCSLSTPPLCIRMISHCSPPLLTGQVVVPLSMNLER